MSEIETTVREKMKYIARDGLSDCGLRVAMLLEELDGLHHFDQRMLARADWTDSYIVLRLRDLATFDFAYLTRLVLLAHDYCVRVDISPSNMQAVRVMFHPRHSREGSISKRHPTIESVLADWRKRRPEPAFERYFSAAVAVTNEKE